MLKRLLKNSLSKYIKKDEKVALMFSGGMDSLTCLFSLMELDIDPVLYTFYLEGKENDDLRYSKKVAEYYGLTQKIVEIPVDVERLKSDVKFITRNLPVDRKTNVQCTFPFLYVLPEVKEDIVVAGICADDLYGSSKGASIKGRKDRAAFDALRQRSRRDVNASAYLPIKVLIEDVYGKRAVMPFRDSEVYQYFLSKSWSELNKPKQKQVAIDAFHDYFEKQDIYRRNSNLQVESGIREYHNLLIDTELNRNNRKRVDEIYKDLMKG